jgi:hypothetical protein
LQISTHKPKKMLATMMLYPSEMITFILVQPSKVVHWNIVRYASPMLSNLVIP